MAEQHAAETHITHDPAYETVAPHDFASMVAVGRYGARSDAFDAIIGATHDHFWDPHNPAYLDYTQPFDLDREPLLPIERFPELNCAATAHLGERDKIRLAVELHDHADFAVVMDVAADEPLASDLSGPLLGLGHTTGPKQLGGLVHVAIGVRQGLLGIHHSGARALPELLNVFCRKCSSRHSLPEPL